MKEQVYRTVKKHQRTPDSTKYQSIQNSRKHQSKH